MRLDFLHSLDDYLGSGDASKQGDVRTHCEWCEHVEGATIGMSQWQERHATGAASVQLRVDTINDIAGKVVASEHHSLAESCGAAGVVDFHELLVAALNVVDARSGESTGIGLLHECVGILNHLVDVLILVLSKQLATVE